MQVAGAWSQDSITRQLLALYDEWPVSLLEWWMNDSGAKELIIEHWKLYI